MTRANVTHPQAAPAAARTASQPPHLAATLASMVGNRAMGRILARAPGDGPPKQPRYGPELSPQEMWDHVLATRGFAGRVPPHAVAEADTKAGLGQTVLEGALADLTEARRDALGQGGGKEAVAGARRQASNALTGVRKAVKAAASAHANASESVTATADAEALHEDALADLTEGRHERLYQRDRGDKAGLAAAEGAVTGAVEHANMTLEGVRATVNRRQLGHGTFTYGAVQVVDEQGRSVAFAIGAFDELHAEVHALNDIYEQLAQRGFKRGQRVPPGWRVVIVVDQIVCGECRKALSGFADEYGIDHADVLAHYPQRSDGSGVTPKRASATAPLHPTEVPVGPGEQVLLQEEPPPPQRGPGGGDGGSGTPPASAPPPPSGPAAGPPTSAPSASASTEPTGGSAPELAEELTAKERWTRRMVSATAALPYALHLWNAWNAVQLAAQSMSMAADTIHHGTPYWQTMRQAQQVDDAAKQIQDHYNALHLEAGMPSKERDPDGWDIVDHLLDKQHTYVRIERDLGETLGSIKEAVSELVRQQIELKDGLEARERALLFPYTSLVWADVILYSSAGGEVNEHVDAAIASYVDAEKAIEAQQRFAQAAAKTLELRLRQLDAVGMFGDIPDSKLAKTRLRVFTIRPR